MTTKSVKTVLKGILSQLGLTKNEVLVYLANLELGSAPASKLAKVAGLNRVTAYEALQRLSKQGLVSIHVKKGTSVKYFQVESIDSVQEKLEQTRLMAEERLHQLDEQKDALRELYKPSTDKPEVSFYQGKEGVKTVIMDTLAQKPSETLSFASGSAVVGFDPAFIQQYFNKRVSMKIPTKGIAPGSISLKGRFTEEVNKKELRQLRFLPAELDTLQHEIEIYGNNVAFTSMKPGDEHGIIIRSKTIAEAMREIHSALWERLEK
jgi:sugar-specific transcriptional regulator TrmB